MITFVAKKPETYQAMMIWDHYGVLKQKWKIGLLDKLYLQNNHPWPKKKLHRATHLKKKSTSSSEPYCFSKITMRSLKNIKIKKNTNANLV